MNDDADHMPERSGRQADWLRRAALHYLERYASSEENLRRVLARKLERRRRADPERWTLAEIEAKQLISDTVARCRELGLVDDARFAEMRAAGGRRRGLSGTRIVAALTAKGVSRDLADAAVAAEATDDAKSALVFARRRRIGPFRPDHRRSEDDDRRDLAVLCRQGYSYTLARRVVTMDRETAEAALDGPDDAEG
jgi:regulatory protein